MKDEQEKQEELALLKKSRRGTLHPFFMSSFLQFWESLDSAYHVPLLISTLFLFCILILCIFFYFSFWLSRSYVRSTLEFYQRRNIPYTLRCTPLSYEIVPNLHRLKKPKKKPKKVD